MLHYALVFLIVALVGAVLGFGRVAASSLGAARDLCVIFATLAVTRFGVRQRRRA